MEKEYMEFLDEWEDQFMHEYGWRGFVGTYAVDKFDQTYWTYNFSVELPNWMMKKNYVLY